MQKIKKKKPELILNKQIDIKHIINECIISMLIFKLVIIVK